MAEQIIGASGQWLAVVDSTGAVRTTATITGGSGFVLYSGDITNIAKVSGGNLSIIGSVETNVALTTDDYVSIVGSPNYSLPTTGSVQVSSIVGALPAGTAILGSVKIEDGGNSITVDASNLDIRDLTASSDYVAIIGSPNYSLPIIGSVAISNASIDVNTTTSDYISIVGSPNYSLPTIGSVQVSSIVGALPAGTSILGSVKIEDGGNSITVDAANLDIRDLATSDYVSIVGSPNYNLPVIGSVQVSSVGGTVTVAAHALTAGTATIGSVGLVAGTALIGSVVADIVGLSTSDYLSIVGSPNYSLPVIGSVQVSSITGALPAGTNNIGDIDVLTIAAGTNLIGSMNIAITRDGTAVIGSVLARISDSPPAWTGIGSVHNRYYSYFGSSNTFDWVGPVTGSAVVVPPTGSRVNITDIICSASGQGIVTVYFDTDNTSNRIVKANLANFGGFVTNYSRPFRGPASGSIEITTAATGFTPVGQITVNYYLDA